jgi:thioredoxin-like negative regulator of GroEL
MGLIDLIWNLRQQQDLADQQSSLSRTSDRAEHALRRVAELEARVNSLAVALDVALELLARHTGLSDDEFRSELTAALADNESRQWSVCPKCQRKSLASRSECLFCGETLVASPSGPPLRPD